MVKEIPYLEQKYLNNCKVISNRYEMLDLLPKNGIYAEIGVLHGDFSQEILRRCKPYCLNLIDLYKMYDGHERYIDDKFIYNKNVLVKKGMSWDVLSEFPDNFFDVIYIDAGHDYESVKKDAEVAVRKLKNDGYLIFNDYILYNNFSKSVEEFGVPQVVHEICMQHDFEFKYLCLHPYMFFDVCLRKRGI